MTFYEVDTATFTGGSGTTAVRGTLYSVTADTRGVTKTATAADRLGNQGTGSVTASTFWWDDSGRRFHHNWAGAKTDQGFYRRIGVRLDDGRAYFINIGLR